MKNIKRELTANHYCDDKLVKSRKDKRVVYKDSKGEFIRDFGKRKVYILNDTYETHSRTIQSTPINELLKKVHGSNGNIFIFGDK